MRALSLALIIAVGAAAVGCSSGGAGRRKQGQNNSSSKKDLASPEDELPGDEPDLSDPNDPGDPNNDGPVDMKKPPADLKQPPTDLATPNGGPTVSTLTASPSYAYDGESITFTVTVGHPIGLDYLYTVVLYDANNNSYGSLYAADYDGVYSTTLSWAQIDAVADLSFTSSTSRSFKVTATDIDYKTKTTSSSSVTFACLSASQACDGVCGGCSSGGTPTMTSCSSSYSTSDTCSSICAANGKTCAATACGGKTISVYYNGCSNTASGTEVGCSGAISSAGYAPSYGDGVSCCCQ